jgi:hypothetical protein
LDTAVIVVVVGIITIRVLVVGCHGSHPKSSFGKCDAAGLSKIWHKTDDDEYYYHSRAGGRVPWLSPKELIWKMRCCWFEQDMAQDGRRRVAIQKRKNPFSHHVM